MQYDTRDTEKLAYSIADSCHRLSIGRTLFYKLVKAGEIKPVRLGSKVLIPDTEIRRVMDKARADAREARVSA